MAIRTGFSTSVCPEWDWGTVATEAARMGFYGVELAGNSRNPHLPAAPELDQDSKIDQVRKLFVDNDVELVSLVSRVSLETPSRREQLDNISKITEVIELAAKLGCSFVRLPVREALAFEPAGRILGRLINPMSEVAEIALRNGVTVLLGNAGPFPGSKDLWGVVDGVGSPSFKAAWNPVAGLGVRESSTVALPRVAAMLGMFMACDARFNDRGMFLGYAPIGDGAVDYTLTVDLLKGMLFDGYLMLDWPKDKDPMLPEASAALPAAQKLLVDRIKHNDPPLTAYKGDKNPPNYGNAPKAFLDKSPETVGVEEPA